MGCTIIITGAVLEVEKAIARPEVREWTYVVYMEPYGAISGRLMWYPSHICLLVSYPIGVDIGISDFQEFGFIFSQYRGRCD